VRSPQPVTGQLSEQLFFLQHFRPAATADHCGLHRTAISLVERGKREPSISTLLKISQGFGLTLSEFLRGVDGVPKKKHR
jgi:transcriptional regulator with XRE-family HTH domain